MSDPVRIKYPSPTFVPSAADIVNQISRDRHLVLEFPPSCNHSQIRTIVDRLVSEVPENYSVFASGSFRDKECVTIKQVISREAVEEIAEYLVCAAKHFKSTATTLARGLAEFNNIPLDQIWGSQGKLKCHSPDWNLHMHGQHCCFIHRISGQTAEVSLWFGTEFGVLDPEFFYKYMRTTADLVLPTDLLDPFHDTRRAMDILEGQGRLVRIKGIFDSKGLMVALSDR